MIVRKPPMGWNSWNTFASNINEQLIFDTADRMVADGYLDAGYEYLVIDDCWSLRERGEDGRIIPDPEKFPHGMKAVADYVHSKGLKFGMYSCCGSLTCAGYPASYEHEFLDAQTFAEWGVDFLKYDNCYKPTEENDPKLYRRMGMALANCGRDILFSACNWGADESHKWIKETGAHMWRSTGDIVDNWASVKSLIDQQAHMYQYNGQGCFNDMDMLIVGMFGKGNVGLGGCTLEEYRTHFSFWSLYGSPLMMGCDLRTVSDECREMLLNKEVIAIDQDEAYRQPFYLSVMHCDGELVIGRLLEGGDIAIGFFNLTDDKRGMSHLTIADLGINHASGKALALRDVWKHEDVGVYDTIFRTPELEPHQCLLYRGKLVDRK